MSLLLTPQPDRVLSWHRKPILVYRTGVTNSSSSSSYTTSAQNIGSEDPTRVVVLSIGFSIGGNNNLITSCTIGGIPATVVQAFNPGTVGSQAFAIARVPTGTTAAASMIFNNNVERKVVGFFTVHGAMRDTFVSSAFDTSNGAATLSLPTASDSVCILGANGASDPTATWPGSFTQHYRINPGGSSRMISASATGLLRNDTATFGVSLSAYNAAVIGGVVVR